MNAAEIPSQQQLRAPSAIILVVEDDLLVRSATAANLRDSGFEVVEANCGDEAVCVLRAELPIDLVFSDINMPGSMDGVALAKWLRRERPQIRMILTSGSMSPRLGEQDVFLAKPYDHTELERRIRDLLGR